MAGDSAAWTALLPAGPAWRPGRRPAARRLRRGLADLTAASSLAVAASPLALAASPLAPGRSIQAAWPGAVTTYIAVPSGQRPVLVASSDAAVLRYVADSVLSVPPGTGPLPSMVLTAGLRLLRFRWAWVLAAMARAGRVILVGRRP